MQNEMIDRLVELIKQAKQNTKNAICDIERNMLFADYLIEHGVIVPPCKVGETVYEIIPKCNATREYCPYSGGYGTARCDKEPCKAYIKEKTFLIDDFDYIGKTVFLTKEEAEKALKERKDNV